MAMDGARSQRFSQSSSVNADKGTGSGTSPLVLSIQCIKGSSRADEWTGDLLQTGDIVEELKIGSLRHRSPFKNGKNWVQKVLQNSFKSKETSIQVKVRRGRDEFAEFQACIVPNELAGRKQYMLRAIDDLNYAVGFSDRTESECLELQVSRVDQVVSEIARTPLQDGYVSYPWEKRMIDMLSVPNSSSFYSMLLLPKASDKVSSRYNDVEDSLARANAWLNASQTSGVPIVFMNVQTESLLTKISGETASSTVNAGSLSDLSNIANASLYGFEDYHGVDIGVVRAVRVWFSPLGGEAPIEVTIKEHDTKLGFAIGRTDEGFIYISSVTESDEETPSSRSGLNNMFQDAKGNSKLLVVSRISNQKVLPWMVSSTGALRCFDTVSLSQKLSLHRHAKVPIFLHVFLWDQSVVIPNVCSIRSRAMAPTVLPLPPEVHHLARHPNDNQVHPLPPEEAPSQSIRTERRLERDTAGEASFRFHDFSLPNNWS